MRVLQINAVYEKFSTGRTTKEMHEELLNQGIESFVASPDLNGHMNDEHLIQIGTGIDWKMHALLSRVTGLQGYFSKKATQRLLENIDFINPDILHLRNLHGNYINLAMILKYSINNNIPVVLTLHDCWFYTGHCVYYIEDKCNRWKYECGSCPALHKGNNSLFFDTSKKMLKDKKKLFQKIENLAVIGVSRWVAEDAKESILSKAKLIDYVYNWIDLQKFQPNFSNKLKEKFDLKNKRILLGVAMVWNHAKGINIFLELADKIPDDYMILLIGKMNDKFVYNTKKLKCVGTISDITLLTEYYAMADIYINPTIQETFGKTAAESLACATPVIAYGCAAMKEIVGEDNSCGRIVNTFESDAFLEAINSIFDDDYDKLSLNCRKRAEKLFEKQHNINQYIEIYKRLIGNYS